MILLSIEEKNALIRLMWNIPQKEDEKYLNSAIEEKRFQICVFCQLHPTLRCDAKGCYILRHTSLAYRNQKIK